MVSHEHTGFCAEIHQRLTKICVSKTSRLSAENSPVVKTLKVDSPRGSMLGCRKAPSEEPQHRQYTQPIDQLCHNNAIYSVCVPRLGLYAHGCDKSLRNPRRLLAKLCSSDPRPTGQPPDSHQSSNAYLPETEPTLTDLMR
jgi:hypothetical protein